MMNDLFPDLGRHAMKSSETFIHVEVGSNKGCVFAVTNTLQNFAYTQSLEPTMDISIIHSLVTTSWSSDSFNLPSWIGSVKVTCTHMLSL